MSDLKLVDFKREHFEEMRAWFEDEALVRAMSIPDEIWFDYLKDDDVTAVAVLDQDDSLVGEIQMDRDPDGLGHLAITIKPEKQNQGIGFEALSQFVNQFGAEVSRMMSYVHQDNSASKRLMESLGFSSDGAVDEEGFMAYARAS